jgi:hypothetical protein
MRLSAEDQKNHPKLAQYVRVSLPTVINVPIIVKNIQKFGSLTKDEFRHALGWGNDPLIIIKDLNDGSCNGVAANGCFDHAHPNQIELDLEDVQNFETDPYGKGSDVNSRGQKVFIVGTTLLHELCHWGNFKHGVAEKEEAGIAFEVATYGRNTG